ncbi:MAG TPA: Uma2 family endonuclease [Bryobacteraceae bacterium]|nr:Uma2 family endonuclease [Bryobacteraceae bacterium]
MATAARAFLENYKHGDFKPERELINGELIPKPMGTLAHMNMERRIEHLLERFEEEGRGTVVRELSICRGEDVRIPDLVFVLPEARFEDGFLIDPPHICLEVLSPSQSPKELFVKCEAYHQWGAPYCWVIDPIKKVVWEYHKDSALRILWEEDDLTAGDIAIPVARIFN